MKETKMIKCLTKNDVKLYFQFNLILFYNESAFKASTSLQNA